MRAKILASLSINSEYVQIYYKIYLIKVGRDVLEKAPSKKPAKLAKSRADFLKILPSSQGMKNISLSATKQK